MNYYEPTLVNYRLKHCDPSKIEELLKGGNSETEIVKSFKNKPNNKKKKKKKGGQQGNPEETATAVNVKVEIPKTADEASSNWATLVRASGTNVLGSGLRLSYQEIIECRYIETFSIEEYIVLNLQYRVSQYSQGQ